MSAVSAQTPLVPAAQRTGRVVGSLLMAQMITSGVVNFVLEPRLFGTQGFLVNAAPHERQIGLAVIIALVSDATWMAVALTAFPSFSQHTRRLGLCLVGLAAVILAVSVFENAGALTMVSVSKAWLRTSSINQAQFETIRVIVASGRNWPHFLARLFHGAANLVFYAGLYQLRLVPRGLAVFGLVAAAIMMAVFAMVILGYDVAFPLLAPMGLSQLLLACWLIVRGFRLPSNDTPVFGGPGGIAFV